MKPKNTNVVYEPAFKVMVTGGAGFIGSAMVRHLISNTSCNILNIDKLTYAGHLITTNEFAENDRYKFIKGDICDKNLMNTTIEEFKPNVVINFAAESHVDNSINSPLEFLQSNFLGVGVLLESARSYWESLDEVEKKTFRFLHISTDEVYGSLSKTGFFSEESRYDPSSPYSATKAASDHLTKAWFKTYGLPTIVSNCSNNYGPYQLPEKLIPLVISNAIDCKQIPVYGDGKQIRDWIFVEDHVRAIWEIVLRGAVGESYNVGGQSEKTNLDVIKFVCNYLDESNQVSKNTVSKRENLIVFVKDRLGHDFRYAIDNSKIKSALGWKPVETFETGLGKTIEWYLRNQNWISAVKKV